MRILMLACLIVVGSCPPSVFAQEEGQATPQEQAPPYVLGELLVKFSEEASKAIEQARQAGTLPVTGIESLDTLVTTYRIQTIECVFGQVSRPEAPPAQGPEGSAPSSQSEQLPDLYRIYKLTLDPAQELQAVIFAFLGNPHVEFAQPNFLATLQAPVEQLP